MQYDQLDAPLSCFQVMFKHFTPFRSPAFTISRRINKSKFSYFRAYLEEIESLRAPLSTS